MALMTWATHVLQWRGQYEAPMKVVASRQTSPCSDCHLQFDDMKVELQVIADQHAAVNLYPSLGHTACQFARVRAA